MTIDGSAIAHPQNVIVPVGTPIKDVVAFCGGYKSEPKKLLMGGPMMGVAIASDELPILKQNNAILAFDEREAALRQPTACIRCGRCVASLPHEPDAHQAGTGHRAQRRGGPEGPERDDLHGMRLLCLSPARQGGGWCRPSAWAKAMCARPEVEVRNKWKNSWYPPPPI